MTATRVDRRTTTIIVALAFIYIAANMILVANELYFLNLLPVAMFAVAVAFVRLDLFYYLIVILTPLSIQLIEFIPGSPVDFAIPTEPMLFGAMLLVFYKALTGGYAKNILMHPVSLSIFFYLFWILFTSVTSTEPLVSFKFLAARLWFVSVFYFLAILVFKKYSEIKTFILCYTIPMTGVIVFTISRHLSYGLNDQLAAHVVMNPFFRDHTSYGAVLAMLLFAFGGLATENLKKHMLIRIATLFVLVILIAALVLSYTRAAWISVFCGAALMGTILLKVKPAIILTACLAIVTILTVKSDSIIDTMQRTREESSISLTQHLKSVSNITTDESNLERINRWNSALSMFRERPLLGWGPGTYMFEYAPFQLSDDMTGISTNSGDKGNAHSEYLGPLAESGVFGLLSFVLIAISGMATGIKVYRRSVKKSRKLLILGMVIALFTYFVHGLLNNFLDTDKASALFWGFLAAFVAIDNRNNRPGRVTNQVGEL